MGLSQNSLEFLLSHGVVVQPSRTWSFLQASLQDCETQGCGERNRGESGQKFHAFPCWPLWEGCRSDGSFPCPVLISGSAAKVHFTPAGARGLNSLSSSQAIWLCSLVAVCFQLAFLLKQNESYGLLSPKLDFSECIESHPRGWEPPWQILNTRWCFQGTVLRCCHSEGAKGETSAQTLLMFSKLVSLGCPK